MTPQKMAEQFDLDFDDVEEYEACVRMNSDGAASFEQHCTKYILKWIMEGTVKSHGPNRVVGTGDGTKIKFCVGDIVDAVVKYEIVSYHEGARMFLVQVDSRPQLFVLKVPRMPPHIADQLRYNTIVDRCAYIVTGTNPSVKYLVLLQRRVFRFQQWSQTDYDEWRSQQSEDWCHQKGYTFPDEPYAGWGDAGTWGGGARWYTEQLRSSVPDSWKGRGSGSDAPS